MLKQYIEEQRKLIEYGLVEKRWASERIEGFERAMDGITWGKYKEIQTDLVESGLTEKVQASYRLEGFKDYQAKKEEI